MIDIRSDATAEERLNWPEVVAKAGDAVPNEGHVMGRDIDRFVENDPLHVLRTTGLCQ